MSLYRVPLMLLSAAGMNVCLTNPNPPVSKDEHQKYSGSPAAPGTVVLYWPVLMKTSYWIVGICESAVILSNHFSEQPLTNHLLSSLVLKPASSISAVQITPAFLAGFFLTACGTYIRLECYRALGRLFTYQLSIRPEHELVTSGPYSSVRHPAYTCGFLTYTGINLCVFGPGSWLRECGWLDTFIGKGLMGVVGTTGIILSGLIIQRCMLEDLILKKEFGQKRDDWAARVPYRLFPFIF